jgi:hypothetical protein
MKRYDTSDTVESNAIMHRNRGVINSVVLESDRDGGLIFI